MHKKAYKEGLTMKKWYRKTVTRTIVLVVAILSGALLVTNLLSLLTLAGGMSLSQIQKMNTQSFEESEEFSKMVESYMYDVQEKLYLQNLFESDGAYNPKKLVDVMELSKKGKISETNLSGVTYTMEELVNWGETYSGTDNDNLYKQNGVIVCQKPDGNYYYYYTNDFFSLINAGKLQFQMGEQDRDQFLAGLQAGEFTTSGYYTFQITDENGDLLIGTWQDGLFRYHLNENKFTHYPPLDNINSVLALFQDSRGVIWIGTSGSGLYKANFSSDKKTLSIEKSYKHDEQNAFSLPSDYIYSIHEDLQTHSLWLGTRNGVGIMDLVGEGVFVNYKESDSEYYLPVREVNTVFRDKNGLMWIGTKGAGVFHVDTRARSFNVFYPRGNGKSFTDLISTLYVEENGSFWIGLDMGSTTYREIRK